MNTHTRIQQYSCPCCGGRIGEAVSLDIVRAAINRPQFVAMFDTLAKEPGKDVERSAIIKSVYGPSSCWPKTYPQAISKYLAELRRELEVYGWTITHANGPKARFHHHRLIPSEAGA